LSGPDRPDSPPRFRLKQVSPDLSVVVIEKGSEPGAHILSGAVIDPVGLDRLLPDWRKNDACPLKTQVHETVSSCSARRAPFACRIF